MSQSIINEIAKAISSAPRSKLTHAPGPGQPNASKAIKRCCSAWQRAYDIAFKDPGNKGLEEYRAEDAAQTAYCNAMPVLAGYEGIRDFVACVAHGVLIGTISKVKSGQLLYAAQVAISTLSREPKPRKSPQK
jgi:hypothetical protein